MPLVGGGLGLLLDLLALLDERLEHLDAFLLGLRESAEPGEPDLVRGFADSHRHLVFRRLFGEFFEFLWHDHPRFDLGGQSAFLRAR